MWCGKCSNHTLFSSERIWKSINIWLSCSQQNGVRCWTQCTFSCHSSLGKINLSFCSYFVRFNPSKKLLQWEKWKWVHFLKQVVLLLYYFHYYYYCGVCVLLVGVSVLCVETMKVGTMDRRHRRASADDTHFQSVASATAGAVYAVRLYVLLRSDSIKQVDLRPVPQYLRSGLFRCAIL